VSDNFKNIMIILFVGSTSFFYWLNHANAVVADDLIETCLFGFYESETQLAGGRSMPGIPLSENPASNPADGML
jgi:hypothetical protein